MVRSPFAPLGIRPGLIQGGQVSLVMVVGWLVVAPVLATEPLTFEQHVLPILKTHCLDCHSGASAQNRFDASDRAGLLTGGKSGEVVRPGSLRDSLLWSFIATDKMPAEGPKLNDQEKDILRTWILSGAHDRASLAKAAEPPGSGAEGASKQALPAKSRGPAETSALIDRQIDARLAAEQVPASPQCDDATLLRRVYLDLCGRIPTPEETDRYLSSQDPNRRIRLVEDCLNSADFGRHQAILWHGLLIPQAAGAYSRIPHEKFRDWLAEQFNQDRPWNEVVTDLITAEGYLPSNKDNENTRKKDAKLQPQNVATAFINVHNTEGRPQPKGIIASVSRLFLAQSIECAQCHNHPLARWKQTDFWAAAAFFERVRYPKAVYGDTSIDKLIEPATGGDLEYRDDKAARYAFVPGVYSEPVIALEDGNGQRTGTLIRAQLLNGVAPPLDPQQSYRTVFAAWATASDNPYFAKALVNRVWAQLMGRGFVEPVDDMSEDNRPSHPVLLDELAGEFAAGGFSVKDLYRSICNSQTYQRSSQPTAQNLAHARLFPHQTLKQLSGEQLLASLPIAVPTFAKVLEEDAKDKNPGLFRRAFLEIHETPVENLRDHTRGLQQALRMMNGDGQLLNRDALQRALNEQRPAEENLRLLYLQALNREPTPEEQTQMLSYIASATEEIAEYNRDRQPEPPRKGQPDRTPDPYADILWVLINSGEFIFNH